MEQQINAIRAAAMAKRAYVGYSPTVSDLRAMQLMQLTSAAQERNRARVLLENGVQDPITAQRRSQLRVLGRALRNLGLSAGAGAAVGAAGGGAAAGLEGATIGAVGGGALGTALWLLCSGISGISGSVAGAFGGTDTKSVADFYNGKSAPSLYNAARASSQLDKAMQTRMAEHQQDAPYQVVQA